MQIRQFEAPNVREAMRKVREAMGPRAIILSTSEKKRNGKPHAVVTAVIEPEPSTPSFKLNVNSRKNNEDMEIFNELTSLRGLSNLEAQPVQSTLYLLRHMIDDALKSHAPGTTPPWFRWVDLLTDRGVSRSTAYLLVQKLSSQIQGRGDVSLLDPLKKALARVLKVTGEIKLTDNSPRFIVFLGPPGVGKTTTLAKMAARLKSKTRRPLVLLSTDVYRIGAMDQLYIYGDLMGLRVEAVRSKRDFQKVLRTYASNTLFLVDTTGRSHLDDPGLMEIKIMIDDMAKEMWGYLLLDAGKKQRDLLAEIKGYSLFPYRSLIWTKMDETEMPGEIVNIMLQTGIPVSYITTGQRVPGDIEKADPRHLVEWILTNEESRRILWIRRQNCEYPRKP